MRTHTTIAFALLALTTGLSAQTQPTISSNANGLLGQRYAEISAGVLDPHGTSDNGFLGDISANVPVQPGLDLGFSYGYGRLHADIAPGTNVKVRDHTAYTSLTAYNEFGGMKPFFGAAVGYQWTRERVTFLGTRFSDREDEAIWGLGTGVEIPVGPVTVTPTITYQDGFKSSSAAGFTYGAEVHTWFTRTVGGFAEATYSDPTGGGTQSWAWKLGARLRF